MADIVGLERGNQVGIGNVHHAQITLLETDACQCPCQQVVRYGELNQVYGFTLQFFDGLGILGYEAVVAVGVVAHDKCSRVHAGSGRY